MTTSSPTTFMWKGYVRNQLCGSTLIYSVGTLEKVTYEWLRYKDDFITSEPYPEICAVAELRKLSDEEQTRFASLLREYEDI